MVYKIVPIKYNSKIEQFQKNNIKHKFLYQSVKDEISLYQENQNSNIKIYSFFGFYFLVVSSQNKEIAESTRIGDFEKLDNSQAYYGHYFNSIQANETISQTLRNSNTLQISEKNSYDNSDINVVLSEDGFVLCSKLNLSAEDKFERVLLLFLLALAYNLKAEKLLQDVSKSYKNNSYDNMIKLRDEIYAFDLNCFFHNPVIQNKHQVYTIWNLIAQNYDVQVKHNEIKSQVSDLTNIIESKHKAFLEEKTRKNEKALTWIGLAIGLASLVSVFKDLKELFGL